MIVKKQTFNECVETLREHGGVICVTDEELRSKDGQSITHVVLGKSWDGGETIKFYNGDPTNEDNDFEEVVVSVREFNNLCEHVVYNF